MSDFGVNVDGKSLCKYFILIHNNGTPSTLDLNIFRSTRFVLFFMMFNQLSFLYVGLTSRNYLYYFLKLVSLDFFRFTNAFIDFCVRVNVWQPETFCMYMFVRKESSWNVILRFVASQTLRKLLAPVVRKPISANPRLNRPSPRKCFCSWKRD